MNCTCLEDIQNKLKNELAEKNDEYKGLTIISAKFKNRYLDFEDGTVIGIPVELLIENKTKKKEICMSIKYCPFCGKRIGKGVAINE